MGLIEWAFTSVGAITVAVLSRLISDDTKAWIQSATERIIVYAASKLPEYWRSEYVEEWRGFVSGTPGEICKLRAALGFLLAAPKMARDLRDPSAAQLIRQKRLDANEATITEMLNWRPKLENMLQSCRDCRHAMDSCPESVRVRVILGDSSILDGTESLVVRELESLPRQLEILYTVSQQLKSGRDDPEIIPALQSILDELLEMNVMLQLEHQSIAAAQLAQ